MKKLLAMMLTVILALTALMGCGGSNDSTTKATEKDQSSASQGTQGTEEATQSNPGEYTLPLTEEKQELTVWLAYSGSVVTDLNEIEGVKKMEELTNVHINWIPIEQQQISDKMGILLTSGSYPDIIDTNVLPGGIDKNIEDGVIRPDHDKLIKTYMPNYMKYLEENETARKQATADDGTLKIVRILVGEDYNVKAEGVYQGVAYRKDLLESLGLEEPKTIEGWHDALVKAKESGIENPFMINTTGGSFLSLAWGVTTMSQTYLQMGENGKVLGAALQDGFGQYLETMRKWYAEGLIDPNFTSFNFYLDTPNSVENNKQLLYTHILSAFTGNNYATYHMVNNQDEFLQPIVAPAADGGETYMDYSPLEGKDQMFITTSCKNPELAAKWLDFFFTKEGELLNWYGIEGTTYTMDADGIPQFTDMVLNDPNHTPPATILEKYALGWGNCWIGKHNTVASEKVATAAAGGMNQQAAAVEIWTSGVKNIGLPSGYTLTEEESDKVSTKQTAVQTLIEEYMVNYIIGNDDTSFEDFKTKLVQFGYQEIIDTYQAAIDRFNNR